MFDVPQYINLSKIGSPSLGYITVAESEHNIPFEIKRVYWTYYTPNDITRGGHAHYDLEQVIFAVSGVIEFTTEDLQHRKQTFILDCPNVGIYLPKMIWRDIKFSHNAVLMCLASKLYDESDYIRDYSIFASHKFK